MENSLEDVLIICMMSDVTISTESSQIIFIKLLFKYIIRCKNKAQRS